jgi:hypothetical protein
MRWVLVAAVVLSLIGCGGSDERLPQHVDPPDAEVSTADAMNPCLACAPGEVCVQRFDGDCAVLVTCETLGALTCAPDTCTEECQAALCGGEPYQCMTRPPCGTEVAGAFTCYGP